MQRRQMYSFIPSDEIELHEDFHWQLYDISVNKK